MKFTPKKLISLTESKRNWPIVAIVISLFLQFAYADDLVLSPSYRSGMQSNLVAIEERTKALENKVVQVERTANSAVSTANAANSKTDINTSKIQTGIVMYYQCTYAYTTSNSHTSHTSHYRGTYQRSFPIGSKIPTRLQVAGRSISNRSSNYWAAVDGIYTCQ